MRLFIALDTPSEVKEHFKQIQTGLSGENTKLKFTNEFHLTLKFLGEVEEKKVEEIKNILSKIQFKPFKLKLTKLGVFPNENYITVVWIGLEDDKTLFSLQNDVEKSLEKFNFKKDFDFKAHITLARVKFVKNKEDFNKQLKNIKVNKLSFEVKEFKLIKSTLTSEGPIYEDISLFASK